MLEEGETVTQVANLYGDIFISTSKGRVWQMCLHRATINETGTMWAPVKASSIDMSLVIKQGQAINGTSRLIC